MTGCETFFKLGLGLVPPLATLNEPPKRPPCRRVAHLLLFMAAVRLLAPFLGPILTYFGSNRLKPSLETSLGSLLSQTSIFIAARRMKENGKIRKVIICWDLI